MDTQKKKYFCWIANLNAMIKVAFTFSFDGSFMFIFQLKYCKESLNMSFVSFPSLPVTDSPIVL